MFDRVQYEAAVLAASADRTWESAGEATARLLRGLLSTDAAVLRTLGFHLTWLTPSHRIPRAWTLSLLVPHPRRTASQRRADAIFDAAERPRSTGQGRGIHTSMWTSRLRRRPWEHEPRQVILELTTDAASPISQAAELYRQLTEVPLADWERTFPRSEHP